MRHEVGLEPRNPGWRRAPGYRLALSGLLLVLCLRGIPAAEIGPPAGVATDPAVRKVESIGFTVADLDRSVAFFTDVLSFEKVSDVELAGVDYERLQGVFPLRMRVARLRLGGEILELTEYLAPRGRAIPIDSRSNDRWFQHAAIVVSDMDRAYRHLREHRVEYASSGPQRLPDWNERAAGIEAFYFKDPDGHVLEVIEFPSDKGDPRWHRRTDRLFLGIDHSAIVVDDTDRSLAFYRGDLGLQIAEESENYGTEQEHLNAVFGARLRITTLRASAGPGIELLEYLAPRDGRPYPSGEHANDLVHWQTRVVTDALPELARVVRQAGAPHVSPGVVDLSESALGFSRGLLIRDPDGHAVQAVEE